MIKKIIKLINWDYIAILTFIFFLISGISVSLNRFWQYEVFYYDFGIFDQAIWKVAHFQAPIIEHLVFPDKWIFADHFSPSIFLLSPFYWFTDRSEILLILQVVAVALSGLVIYQIGKETVKNKFLSFSVLVAYFLFVGLQNAIITDFHEVTVMVLPFTLMFWAIIRNKKLFYLLLLFITLGFKENSFSLGIGLGLAILLIKREWYKIALFTLILSIFYGLFAIKVIIPSFSAGTEYQYYPIMPSNFLEIFKSFFDQPIKVRTLFYSFFSFGFLPIFSFAFLPLIIQDFFVRFVPQSTNLRWDLGLHYSIQLAPILAISSLFSIKQIQKNKTINSHAYFIGIFLILNSLYLCKFTLNGPLNMAYNPSLYKHTEDFKFLDNLILKLPKGSSVTTQNNIAVRFDHGEVRLLRDNFNEYSTDYIFLDLRKGQNPNNFFGAKNVPVIMEKLMNSSEYELIYKTKEQFIFKKRQAY